MLARNQYGETIFLLGIHPRKELLDKLSRKHADKIFIDSAKHDKTYHVGYVMAGGWWSLYTEWQKEMKQ